MNAPSKPPVPPSPRRTDRTPWSCAALASLAIAAASLPAAADDDAGEETGAAAPETRAFLGVHPVRVTEELASHLRLDQGVGLRVEFVHPDSPAEKAGLERHDVLVALDDQWLTHPEQLAVLVGNRQPGESVTLTLIHRGERVERPVTLGERPADLAGTPGDPLVIERIERSETADPDSPGARLEALVQRALEKSRERFDPPGELGARLRETIEKALRDAGLATDRSTADPGDAGMEADASEGSEEAVEREDRRVESSSSSSVSISLGTGDGMTIHLTEKDGGQRRIVATDRDGAVLYDGPFTGDAEADGIPPKVREKLHLLDNVEIRTESKVETR